MSKVKTETNVNTKVKEIRGLELKYNHFMNSYLNFKKAKISLVDILLMTVLVYLINPQNEVEKLSKKFFIEFSHKILGMSSGLIFFVVISFGTNFDLLYTSIAFGVAVILGIIPIALYDVILKQNLNATVFKSFNLIKNNVAVRLSL